MARCPDRTARTAALRGALTRLLGQVLPATVDERAAGSVPFAELGLDSLRATEVRNRLQRGLGMRVPVTVFWAYPTLDRLTVALADRLPPAGPRTDARAEPPARAGEAVEALLALLDGADDTAGGRR